MQKDVQVRSNDGLKIFGAMKIRFIVRNMSLGVKRELYERVVCLTVSYGAQTWCMKIDERHKLGVMDMKCLKMVCVVTKPDR